MAKKKVVSKVRKSSPPKRIHMSSKQWAIGSVIVLAIAIPVTMSLVSQSQDIRQQASETRINSTVITTMPTDILIIDVSNEDGNAQQDNSNGDGNNQNGKPSSGGGNKKNQKGGGDLEIEGSEECETQDTTERSGGGTLRTIMINCDGANQSDDQSGSDGNNQTINSGGKDGQIAAPKGNKGVKEGGKAIGKNAKQGKRDGRSDNRNWIQQFIDRILGRQGR